MWLLSVVSSGTILANQEALSSALSALRVVSVLSVAGCAFALRRPATQLTPLPLRARHVAQRASRKEVALASVRLGLRINVACPVAAHARILDEPRVAVKPFLMAALFALELDHTVHDTL